MYKNNNKRLYFTLTLLLLILSTSCGYHLRGNIALPERYQTVHILDKGSRDISLRLKQVMLENKVTLVDSAELASSIITVYSRQINRRAIAVRGKEVKEYEIQLNVSFAVQNTDGSQRGESQNISSIRRYSYNNAQVLGASNEEQILIKEMQDDIVRQILRRLTKI
ncbi:MAG: LPS assembly lipoprotein LptE [Pseudomonadota bacterium]